MIEDVDGLPVVGTTAVKLGVRPGIDIFVDPKGLVFRPSFKPGDPNGLSCSPTIGDLPLFALPVAWGGSNPKTAVWQIRLCDLGPELLAQEDTVRHRKWRHISIGPSGPMLFDDYVRAILATRSKWVALTRS
jgi:hypothetical protein